MTFRLMQLAAWDYSFQMHLLPLVEACRSAGFQVVCAGSPGPFVDELAARGLEWVSIPFHRGLNPWSHATSLRRLVEVMREQKIDVLHSHTFVAGLLGRIAARVVGVPASVYTAHGFHFHEHMSPLPYWGFAACEWVGAALSDHLFVQSEEDRVTALAMRMAPPDRIQTIGSGIDLNVFSRAAIAPETLASLRAELGIRDGAKVVTIIARPTHDKGLATFSAMVQQINREDVVFVAVLPLLAGDRCVDLTHRNELASQPNTRVLDLRNDVREILAISDLFVLPTRFEGISRVLLEAMAMSVPIVVSNVRGCREVIDQDETGCLLPVGDAKAFSETVLRLLDDEPLRHRMGERGRAVVGQRFDLKSSLEKQIEVMERLARERVGRHHARN